MVYCVTHGVNYPVHVHHVGLKVVEVAHDIQHQVSVYITKTLNLVNSFDTWHCEIVICSPGLKMDY